MLFEDVYLEYLSFARYKHKKEAFFSIQSIFKANILSFFKGRLIDTVTKKDILFWCLEIEKRNYSNNYNKNCYYTFLRFLDYCVDFYDFPKNYLKDIGPFRKRNQTKKFDFYTLDEFNLFIQNVDNEIYKQFFNFMFFAGTRPGETFALQFKDIQGSYISINKTLTSHGGRQFDDPKTKNSFRFIMLDDKLLTDILALKKLYDNCNDDFFIFGGEKPLSVTSVNRYKIKACYKSNIRPITLHQFRHSHATLLVHSNIMINEISRRLGHSDVSITLNTYVHTDKSQEKRVYDTLNSYRAF